MIHLLDAGSRIVPRIFEAMKTANNVPKSQGAAFQLVIKKMQDHQRRQQILSENTTVESVNGVLCALATLIVIPSRIFSDKCSNPEDGVAEVTFKLKTYFGISRMK